MAIDVTLCTKCIYFFVISVSLTTCTDPVRNAERELLRQLQHPVVARMSVASANVSMQVDVDLVALQMILNVPNEQMSLTGILKMSWSDPSYSWDPSKFKGILQVALPGCCESCWKPRIMTTNSVDMARLYVTPTSDASCILRFNGILISKAMVQFDVHCPLNLGSFPFDRHDCSVKFMGENFYNNITIRYANIHRQHKISSVWDDSVSKEWKLLSSHIEMEDKVLQFRYRFRRRPTYYIILTFVPFVVSTLATVTIFLLPPMSREKLFMGGTAILVQLLLLFHLTWITPNTSTSVPVIVTLCTCSLTMSVAYLFLTILTMIFSHHRRLSLFPNLVKKILKGWCGTILCLPISKSQMRVYRAHFVSSVENVSLEPSTSSTDEYQSAEDYREEWLVLCTALDRLLFLLYCCSYITLIACYCF